MSDAVTWVENGVEKTIKQIGKRKGSDSYAIYILLEELSESHHEFKEHVERDSYKHVMIEEGRIDSLCNAIKKLRGQE